MANQSVPDNVVDLNPATHFDSSDTIRITGFDGALLAKRVVEAIEELRDQVADLHALLDTVTSCPCACDGCCDDWRIR